MSAQDHNYYVYFVASHTRVLYCGVTNNLLRRVLEDRDGTTQGFSKSYNCKRLVYYENFKYIDNAIAREKQLKRWNRSKKLALIAGMNPIWIDLSEAWLPKPGDLSTPLRSGRDDKSKA